MRHILTALLLCLSICWPIEKCGAAENASIVYVASGESEVTRSFFQKIKSEFGDKANYVNVNSLENIDPKEPHRNLYIAAGNRALESLFEKDAKGPILAIFISRTSFQQILQGYGRKIADPEISAIYSDPSPLQQFFLIHHLFEHSPRTAVIISGKTSFLRADLKKAAELAKVPLQISVQTDGNINETLSDIRDAEVLLALPDSSIYNSDSIPRIILSAYRHNQSIIGFSRQFVKAGGLATVYSDSNDIQDETIKAVKAYLSNGTLQPPTYPKQFNIEVNEQVAASYNLVIPDKSTLKKGVETSLEAYRAK